MNLESHTHIVLAAPHDRNGNPRRVSLLLSAGDVVKVHDHGHSGGPRGWPVEALRERITPGSYREWLQHPAAS